MQTIAIFLVSPLDQLKLLPSSAFDVITALIVAIVFVVCSGNRTAETIIVSAAAVDAVATLLAHLSHSAETVGIDVVARMIFLVAVIVVVGAAVFDPVEDVTHHRIQGAIAVYLNIALLFATAFRGIDALFPGALSISAKVPGLAAAGGRYVYFSFVTLTSTGYGDIIPLHPLARSIANLESLTGQLFPAIFLARLVTLELEARRARENPPPL